MRHHLKVLHYGLNSCPPDKKLTIKISFQWNDFAEWPLNGMALPNNLFNFPDCKCGIPGYNIYLILIHSHHY